MHLGGEDAAWLHMEDAANPMVVSGLLELGGPLAVATIAGRLAERLLRHPHFRARVVEPRVGAGVPRWEPDASFDVARHVEHVELADEEHLRAFVGQAASRLLDRGRPLWHVYVLDRPGAGTAVLFRVHHCIGDGFALLSVLLALCDEDADANANANANGVAGATPMPRGHARARGTLHDVLMFVRAAARLLALRADPKSILKGHLGREKRVAWTAPLPLGDVKAVAHLLGATVNDVLVAVVAGALRRYAHRRGERPRSLRAMVPVNLRLAEVTPRLGNRIGLVVLDLPIGVAEPSARVLEVQKRMRRLQATHEGMVAHLILRAMGWAPRWLEGLGVGFFGKKGSLVLTNVPGPRHRLYLESVPVDRIQFWVPQSGRMGLGMSIFSYANEVTIGVMSDAGLVPDPEVLAADAQAELDALLAAELVGTRGRGA